MAAQIARKRRSGGLGGGARVGGGVAGRGRTKSELWRIFLNRARALTIDEAGWLPYNDTWSGRMRRRLDLMLSRVILRAGPVFQEAPIYSTYTTAVPVHRA